MKKPTNDAGRILGAPDGTDSPFINPDAPSGPGPEPSLAMRMARATMNDAFQTEAPPFDGDTRRHEAAQRTPAGRSGRIESAPVGERGGRVDAVGATFGRGDRAGAAAAGTPVQSVGAAMTTPRLPEPGGLAPDADPTRTTHAPKRDDGVEADRH